MLSVDEAIAGLLSEIERRDPVDVALDSAFGLILAADIASDVDSPPFDKSQMDGFAVRAQDVTNPPILLDVIEEVTAGNVPQRPIGPEQATRIMTGAPLPPGADAIVPIEQCDFTENGERVTVQSAAQVGAYVIRRGASMRLGEIVLSAGTRLQAPQIGLLAELGRTEVSVFQRPIVSILATGDELVEISEKPGPGQIRNSNETMLEAQIENADAWPCPLGIARDERDALRAKITEGLGYDLLCLSGGVSAGKLDLVPSELQAAGVREVFHKVEMKPGKPVWFGKLDADRAADGRPHWIFGLPGNPVSSMVCFELFVRTALRKLMGIDPAKPQAVEARLETDHTTRGDRPTYFPARLEWNTSGPTVRPVNWRGSFDLRATADANAMIHFPSGERTYNGGDTVMVIPW